MRRWRSDGTTATIRDFGIEQRRIRRQRFLSKTSSAAPAMKFSWNALASALSPITGPRELFTKYAVGFINLRRGLVEKVKGRLVGLAFTQQRHVNRHEISAAQGLVELYVFDPGFSREIPRAWRRSLISWMASLNLSF